MSWLQWQDEVWPATEAEAELKLHLWLPDSACPRQAWSCDVHHCPIIRRGPENEVRRWAGVDLMNLNLQVDDWRKIADREIRADAAWHDLYETTNEHGHFEASELSLAEFDRARDALGEKCHQHWVAHDFIIRLGRWEGFVLPWELDGWMIRDDLYYRQEPESAEEVARFAEGPPNLRVLARMRFARCSVLVERCEDPLPRAREYLKRAVGLDLPSDMSAKIDWDSYRRLPDGKSEPRPGWTSTVTFELPTK